MNQPPFVAESDKNDISRGLNAIYLANGLISLHTPIYVEGRQAHHSFVSPHYVDYQIVSFRLSALSFLLCL